MDDENQFWVRICVIIGLAFIVFVLTVGGCTMHQNKLVAESPDPVATSCALSGGQATCMTIAARIEHK